MRGSSPVSPRTSVPILRRMWSRKNSPAVDALAEVFVSSAADFRGTSSDSVIAHFDQGGTFIGAAALVRLTLHEIGRARRVPWWPLSENESRASLIGMKVRRRRSGLAARMPAFRLLDPEAVRQQSTPSLPFSPPSSLTRTRHPFTARRAAVLGPASACPVSGATSRKADADASVATISASNAYPLSGDGIRCSICRSMDLVQRPALAAQAAKLTP